MSKEGLPPGQYEIKEILRWNIDHPGITKENPKLDLEKWSLTIDGEVEKPIRFSWKDLLNLPTAKVISDFHCVEGWSVRNCEWEGVGFIKIVDMVKPTKNAHYVTFECADGYTTSLELKELLKENVLLAYRLNGSFLEPPLGGPLRLVVPDKYAYKSAMWVQHILFTSEHELGFWEKRGYSDIADVWRELRFQHQAK